MKKLYLAVIILIVIGVFGLTACGQVPDKWEISYETAYAQAVSMGYAGSIEEFIIALKGESGESAYDIAVRNGFEGTEVEWLVSLKGERGEEGLEGHSGVQGYDGEKGDQGESGESAYDIAVRNGFEGTEVEWLISLIGELGEQGIQGFQGENGLSTYDIAVNNGFGGTEVEWLASLKGDKGDDGSQGNQGTQGDDGKQGLSAYDVAKFNGFVGTQQEWLISLMGEPRDSISNIISQNQLLSSVVSIKASLNASSSLSSGIVITSDGYILTNAHCVVKEFATVEEPIKEAILFDTIVATFKGDETSYSLDVIHYDDTKDLAILKMANPPQDLVPVVIANTDDINIGDLTIVVGNAIGFGITASAGIVSETTDLYEVSYLNGAEVEAIRTDAAINPGNSGGGLFNEKGHLIGINTFKIASELFEGLGFGLSTNFAVDYIDSVISETIIIDYIVAK